MGVLRNSNITPTLPSPSRGRNAVVRQWAFHHGRLVGYSLSRMLTMVMAAGHAALSFFFWRLKRCSTGVDPKRLFYSYWSQVSPVSFQERCFLRHLTTREKRSRLCAVA